MNGTTLTIREYHTEELHTAEIGLWQKQATDGRKGYVAASLDEPGTLSILVEVRADYHSLYGAPTEWHMQISWPSGKGDIAGPLAMAAALKLALDLRSEWETKLSLAVWDGPTDGRTTARQEVH